MNNNNYRYQLERYRGRGSRYTSPQCHRKQSFTRYIDTYNNNIYINDNVCKCNRLDKCGYHYTPKQYFEEHPQQLSSAGDLRFSKFQNHRVFENLKIEKTNQPRRIDYIPEEYWVRSRFNGVLSDHVRWLVTQYGVGFSYRVSSFMEGREQGADIADLA